MKQALLAAILFILSSPCECRILSVGRGQQFQTLKSAADSALPGDTILIINGPYYSSTQTGTLPHADDLAPIVKGWNLGGDVIRNLRGSPDKWITVIAESPGLVTINGGSIHFSDPAYLRIEGLIFRYTTGNGLNIDDSGTFDTPAHDIIIENCVWQEMNATGNLDELKMSGVINFTVRNCSFMNGSKGGSLIDMVGCHNGLIEKCHFFKGGSNSIQAKGGSEEIIIHGNRFEQGGERAINMGGSTGMQYFRPAGADYEARKIKVWSNIFKWSVTPFAFAGSSDCEVINNTVILPERWVLRILQENTNPRMKPCSNNIFMNNIIVFGASGSPAVNIGPNTRPETFLFSNNLWYNPSDLSWQGPDTPSAEKGRLLNIDPRFADEDFHLKSSSPAIGNGFNSKYPLKDYFGSDFLEKRSIGAVEGFIR